ncbi:M67 family metallopeptidase, partial [Halodesulfurarchaeum sp.]
MQLAASVRESIVEHALEAAPKEACGLLGGRTGPPATVQDSIRTPNVASTPTRRFEIDPEALLAGRETFIEKGVELIGFYHSHPNGPNEP